MNPSRLVEELVATVARAFYEDTTVTIFDALVHEKFIRDEELGPRLKLPNKEVKKIVTQLETEGLVSYEDLTMDDLQTSRCWYIDYRKFMLIAHYRIYLMQKEMQEREKQHANRLYFECPTCHHKQSDLEAMRLIGKDMKSFICPHCCPYRNIRDSDPEPYFTLIEYNNKSELAEMEVIKGKMSSQLSEVPGFHAGLFDILARLKEIPPEEVSRNKPADNIKRGNVNSKVTDADILKEIEENSKKMRGKPKKEGSMADRDGDFSIEIAGDDSAGAEDKEKSEEPAAKKQKSMPFFIGGSRVYGRADSALSAGGSESSDVIGSGNAAHNDTKIAQATAASSGQGASKEYRFGENSEHNDASAPISVGNSISTPASSVAPSAGTTSVLVQPVVAEHSTNKPAEEEDLQDLADIEWEE